MSTENSLVSIVIPFYNRSKIMAECLEKIQDQTYKSYEIIAVDDGSTEEYDESLIEKKVDKFIRLEKNSGPGYARQIGREAAHGDFIAYLDSDDWWSPNFLAACVSALIQNPECGMAYTNTIQLENGIKFNNRLRKKTPDKILPALFKMRSWSTASSVWRKEVSLPEFWKAYRDHEDYLHEVLCASKNNAVKFVSEAETFTNIVVSNRTEYQNSELLRSLRAIIESIKPNMTEGLFAFVTKKLDLNSVKIDYACLQLLLRASEKDNDKHLNRFPLIYTLHILHKFSIERFRHRIVQNLKRE